MMLIRLIAAFCIGALTVVAIWVTLQARRRKLAELPTTPYQKLWRDPVRERLPKRRCPGCKHRAYRHSAVFGCECLVVMMRPDHHRWFRCIFPVIRVKCNCPMDREGAASCIRVQASQEVSG